MHGEPRIILFYGEYVVGCQSLKLYPAMNTSSMIQVIKLNILSLWNLTIRGFYPKTSLNLLTNSFRLATQKLALKDIV